MMRIALVLPMLALGLLAPDNGRPESLNDQPQADLVLRGTVRDQSGLPVPRALVYIDGTQLSTDTDITGGFELALDPPRAGTLIVFRDGFSAVAVAFDPLALESSQIVLLAAPVEDSVTVTAPRAPAPPASTFAMRPLDVVRTPGAAADLMRALQTLPGIAQVDEGAGLYVRGGDTSEVLVLLDDAVVFHPYRAETPGGGLFGSVEPFLLEGVSFATGGFSARYGNALSAVLDMHGLRRPDTKQVSLTLGLAGASIRAALPIGERGGVRISGNRSFPGLLFAVNGRPYDFNPLPGGWDVNGSAHYNSPAAGHFKAFVGGSGDGVGVHIDSLSFAGLLTSSTVRFSDRLRVSVDVPDPLRSLRVPPFLLQPLVENAIRHGVAPVSGPVFVRIAAHRIGDRVRIEVVDSGRGFDYTNGARRGLGLQLTERRLHAHARLGELSVERRADGFAVVVTLPA